jgi:hypothetical protein
VLFTTLVVLTFTTDGFSLLTSSAKDVRSFVCAVPSLENVEIATNNPKNIRIKLFVSLFIIYCLLLEKYDIVRTTRCQGNTEMLQVLDKDPGVVRI